MLWHLCSLDVQNGYQIYLFEWLDSEEKKAQGANQVGRYEHLQRLRSELYKHLRTKYIPPYLSKYLAQLSIAGPAVCFARMCNAYWTKENTSLYFISDMVMATATLFNKAESEMILEKKVFLMKINIGKWY